LLQVHLFLESGRARPDGPKNETKIILIPTPQSTPPFRFIACTTIFHLLFISSGISGNGGSILASAQAIADFKGFVETQIYTQNGKWRVPNG
jgi:hypothetical protein